MIGIAFVNFWSEGMITGKVEQLRSEGFAVRVADNSRSYPLAEERVAMPYNAGFGGGCNRAAESFRSGVDTVCFHNPDAEISVDAIRGLVERLWHQRAPGVIAPAERVGPLLRPAGYRYPSVVREMAIAVGRNLGPRRQMGSGSAAGRERVASVAGRRFGSGALLVVDRAAHVEIGGFDERYFMYGEDLDYWHRMQTAGRSAEFAAEIVVDHRMGTGSPLEAAKREILRWLGVELFSQVHRGHWLPLRLVHRAALTLLRQEGGRLADGVGPLWRQGLRPVEVSARLRPGLASGTLLA